MKKFAKIVTVFVLIMAIMVPVFASAEGNDHAMYVKTSTHQRLNMRNACDYTDPTGVIMTIPYGASVTFLDFVRAGRWAMIEYNGRVGYVVSQCLSLKPVNK